MAKRDIGWIRDMLSAYGQMWANCKGWNASSVEERVRESAKRLAADERDIQFALSQIKYPA